jgi:hypothetical protein
MPKIFRARFGASRRFLKETSQTLTQIRENVAIWEGSGASSSCLAEFRSLQSRRKLPRDSEPAGHHFHDLSAPCSLLGATASSVLLAASERTPLAAGANGWWHGSLGSKWALSEPPQVRFVNIRI